VKASPRSRSAITHPLLGRLICQWTLASVITSRWQCAYLCAEPDWEDKYGERQADAASLQKLCPCVMCWHACCNLTVPFLAFSDRGAWNSKRGPGLDRTTWLLRSLLRVWTSAWYAYGPCKVVVKVQEMPLRWKQRTRRSTMAFACKTPHHAIDSQLILGVLVHRACNLCSADGWLSDRPRLHSTRMAVSTRATVVKDNIFATEC
jgi:hypothetical protein